MPRIELFPSGKVLEVSPGTPLREVLFNEGGEFPCGGNGRCRGCRVRLLKGHLPTTAADEKLLSTDALDAGWRLSCQAFIQHDLNVEIAQWELSILGDESPFSFLPRNGFAVAVDLGTTTIVAQLIDLSSGSVLGVSSALNAQAQHGADLMTRIEFALHGGATRLTHLVRVQLGEMIAQHSKNLPHPDGEIRDIVIVGNTAMHHFFGGLSVESLAQHPFEPLDGRLLEFEAGELGWSHLKSQVSFLPCLGSFVGSDLLAGILATGLHKSDRPVALLDLGTNGEIVIGNRERILCASTAAGPAFEGARISMGMRAATGAISNVRYRDGAFECNVLGGGEPRGICGSGLADAVAAGLDCGAIRPNGRLATANSLPLSKSVSLTQQDVRELQLAKSAIAAGLQIVAAQWGIRCEKLGKVCLAGAFGNYIDQTSARRIGLLPVSPEQLVAAGNTALLGAKMALFRDDRNFDEILRKVRHVPLNECPAFQNLFVEQMLFPNQ